MTKTAEFIRTKRIEKGLMQTEVAKKLGYSSQFVANWERGVSNPPKHIVKSLSETLGVPMKDLVSVLLTDFAKNYLTKKGKK